MSERKKAALHNLGCKVNSYETEAMQELLERAGYEIVPFAPGADVYVINTCTVTNMADRKSRQMLHRAKKMNPDAIVVAAGCYVQAAVEEAAEDKAIDIIIGNNQKKDLVNILENFRKGEKPERGYTCDGDCGDNCTCKREPEKTEVSEISAASVPELASIGEEEFAASVHETQKYLKDLTHEKEYEKLKITHTTDHTRAYIKVQDGCNQFCSYCIIPYARGRVRSRELADVLAEVKGLAGSGFQEIVLTGIHLSSYGIDNGGSLLELILKTMEVPGIRRVRLGSLEPRIITEEFVNALKDQEKFCPHFHLSLQSGCDATLKRMNRRYTAEEYYEKCMFLRENFSHPALTTDVIVGFPGETEQEFAGTVAFLKKVAFYETHIFKYSRRKGTKAAAMDHQVPEKTKTKRSDILLKLDKEHRKEYEAFLTGTGQEVLFEESVTIDGKDWFVGHTKEYVKIAVPAGEDLSNQLRTVKVSGERTGGLLTGEILSAANRFAPSAFPFCPVS